MVVTPAGALELGGPTKAARSPTIWSTSARKRALLAAGVDHRLAVDPVRARLISQSLPATVAEVTVWAAKASMTTLWPGPPLAARPAEEHVVAAKERVGPDTPNSTSPSPPSRVSSAEVAARVDFAEPLGAVGAGHRLRASLAAGRRP
jgi:hypothetical protein